MTLEQLRIFVEVASIQHLTKAAENLHLSQSAVSAAIKALEQRYDVKLFDRVGRSLALNPVGRAFLVEAKEVLDKVKVAERTLSDVSDLSSGELNVMASRTAGTYWLPPHLSRFKRCYPGVTLKIALGNSEEVVGAVQSGSTEIGIIESPFDEMSYKDMSCRKVAQDEMIVVVSAGHPWADAVGEIRKLSESPWVLREHGSGTRSAFDRLLSQAGLDAGDVSVEMEFPDNQAIICAVETGFGATLISRAAVAAALEQGRLIQVNVKPIPRPYYLLTSDSRYRTKAATVFEQCVRDWT
jgi:DNA-binding transcriptional LysR family regulator